MPSIFQLSGSPFGMTVIPAPIGVMRKVAVRQPLRDASYGSRFIRSYDTAQFSGLGFGVMPSIGTIALVGVSAAAGAFAHHWWMKRKRRR